MHDLLPGILYSSFFILFIFLVEVITRTQKWKSENTRRVLHTFSGLFALAMAYTLKPWVFLLLLLGFFISISFSFFNSYFSSIHAVKRKTIGELLFPIGLVFAFLLSQGVNDYFASAVLILSCADPLASLVGMSTKKTYYGSFAFGACSFIILLALFSVSNLPALLVIAVLLTVVEKYSVYGTDNFTIPVVSTILLKLFFQS